MIGRVKSWNRDRGYGFIEADGQDYYTYYRDLSDDFICADEKKNLDVGEIVHFIPRTGAKGQYAVNVKVVV